MEQAGRRITVGGLTAVAAAILIAPAGAAGATIEVTTEDDHFDGAKCSLRDAIESANTNAKSGNCSKGSGADKIVVPAGKYKLMNAEGTDEDANVDGDLDILGPVTIKGAGSGKTTIDGNGEQTEERVFNAPEGDKTTLEDMTIRNGLDETGNGAGAVFSYYGTKPMMLEGIRAVANYGDGYGRAVGMWGTGKLTIADSAILENDVGGYGGGVYSYDNDVEITNTRIDGNVGDDGGGAAYLEDIDGALIKNVKARGNAVTDSGYGGGIYVDDAVEKVRIQRSDLSSNSINYDSGQYGGGLYLYESDVLLADSTVSGNFVDGYGGGIYQDAGTLEVRGSTISRNAVTADAGGIYQSSGDLEIANSTISGNNAYEYAGGIYASGVTTDLNNVTVYRNQSYNQPSGIGVYESAGTLSFANSIIAKNRYEGAADYYDCSGGTSAGNNLVSDGAGCNTTGDDIVGDSDDRVDPRLGPLENNGGPTATHALEAGSPALGEGGPGCEDEDQRGESRANACDLGAFER